MLVAQDAGKGEGNQQYDRKQTSSSCDDQPEDNQQLDQDPII